MNDLDFYKALRNAVEEYTEKEGISFSEFVEQIISTYGEPEPVTLVVGGSEIVLGGKGNPTEGNDYEIIRLDEDAEQVCWFTVNKDDKFVIFDDGSYDSWAGGEWNNEIRVGTMKQVIVTYPEEVK